MEQNENIRRAKARDALAWQKTKAAGVGVIPLTMRTRVGLICEVECKGTVQYRVHSLGIASITGWAMTSAEFVPPIVGRRWSVTSKAILEMLRHRFGTHALSYGGKMIEKKLKGKG